MPDQGYIRLPVRSVQSVAIACTPPAVWRGTPHCATRRARPGGGVAPVRSAGLRCGGFPGLDAQRTGVGGLASPVVAECGLRQPLAFERLLPEATPLSPTDHLLRPATSDDQTQGEPHAVDPARSHTKTAPR